MKKYTVEVPIYASPVEHLIELNRPENIQIVMFGGFPNSPLNGGRFNYGLDGFFLWNRLFFNLTKGQLAKLSANFYLTVEEANRGGIPFYIAFTNMFVSQEELNEENLSAVAWLVASSKKYGLKNGVILNNKLLEDFLRRKYGDSLLYISSCTKYYSPRKILTPRETRSMYLRDSGAYDFICLTPQDSRRESLIKDVLAESKSRITAICNTYCGDRCNSYHHYAFISKENKTRLLASGIAEILLGPFQMAAIIARAFAFIIPRTLTCTAFRTQFCPVNIKKFLWMQLNAGVTNFKLGRGFGDKSVDLVVSLLQKFEEGLSG
ncbi:MAG: hypothetical protein WC409_03635 [Candidatus Omnitrophota bacterium]|jgi:hypothetical protein